MHQVSIIVCRTTDTVISEETYLADSAMLIPSAGYKWQLDDVIN
jgi:hypothetical protein